MRKGPGIKSLLKQFLNIINVGFCPTHTVYASYPKTLPTHCWQKSGFDQSVDSKLLQFKENPAESNGFDSYTCTLFFGRRKNKL